MNLREAILGRRSVRSGYTDKPIPQNVLMNIIESGVYAPSGSNSQGVRFLLMKDKAEIERIGSIRKVPMPGSPKGIVQNASVLVLVFTETRKGLWSRLPYQDSAAAIQNMLLTATAHGVASCWISAYLEMDGTQYMSGETWADTLASYDIPDDLEIMGVVMLGYADNMSGDLIHHGRPVARGAVEGYLL